MLALVVISSLYLVTIQSAPCIPANTCFADAAGSSNSMFDSSYKFSCSGSSPRMTKTEYGGTVCSGAGQTDTVRAGSDTGRYKGDLVTGVQVQGSTSGTILADYLQGYNCNPLTAASDSCTDYMMFKRYGNKGHTENGEGRPYLDIGDGCTGKGSEYDQFVVPLGCVLMNVGSNFFGCNSTHIWWDHWSDDSCGNTAGARYETAQSDWFEVNKCATFEEWTHCGINSPQTTGGTNTICDDDDGVQQIWDYYFELDCCGDCTNQGSETVSGPSQRQPTDASTPSPVTPSPVTSGGGSSGGSTPSPVTSGGGPSGSSGSTPSPSTPSPSSSSGNNPSGNNPSGSSGTPQPTRDDGVVRVDVIVTMIIMSIFWTINM